MTNSPIRAGFAQVLRTPRVIFFEIAWRWAFGLGAALLLLAGFHRLVSRLEVTPTDVAAFHSLQAPLIVAALINIFRGGFGLFVRAALIVFPAISIWWTATATAGRVATLEALVPERQARIMTMVRSNALRVVGMWMGAFLWFATVYFASTVSYRLSSNPDQPNLLVYSVLVLLILPFVAAWWGAATWYLFLASIFCFTDSVGAWAGYRMARSAARANRGAVFNVSLIYGIARFVALVALVAVCAVASAILETRAAVLVIVLLSLAYFALADFLFIARLASYLAVLRPETDQSLDNSDPALARTGGAGL